MKLRYRWRLGSSPSSVSACVVVVPWCLRIGYNPGGRQPEALLQCGAQKGTTWKCSHVLVVPCTFSLFALNVMQ